MKIRLLPAIIVLFASAGCYYDNEEELYNCAVDAANVKYATTVNSLLTSYGCIGCHGTIAPSGNIILNTHAGVKAAAQTGQLYGSITHAAGFSPMPQGGSKMNACDIKKIKAWIDAGMPDN